MNDDPHDSKCPLAQNNSLLDKIASKGSTFQGNDLYNINGFVFMEIPEKRQKEGILKVRSRDASKGDNCRLIVIQKFLFEHVGKKIPNLFWFQKKKWFGKKFPTPTVLFEKKRWSQRHCQRCCGIFRVDTK